MIDKVIEIQIVYNKQLYFCRKLIFFIAIFFQSKLFCNMATCSGVYFLQFRSRLSNWELDYNFSHFKNPVYKFRAGLLEQKWSKSFLQHSYVF